MSKNLILFVFEGAKKESQVFNSFKSFFSDSNRIIESAYCTTIYGLYEKIQNDEEVSLFGILKENPNNKNLKNFKAKQFAEIYLFFDYDGHTNISSDDKLLASIKYFNEETKYGKLYISYPMVESLKHYNNNEVEFKNLQIECKKNVSYKKIVNRECAQKYIDFNIYNKNIWNQLIKIHLKKMNYIINQDYSFPLVKFSQKEIFESQLETYIKIQSKVAVLSAFPVFLFDYIDLETTDLDNFFR